MWPHSLHIVAGEAIVGVGTDDAEIAAQLIRFAMPAEAAATSARTPDFGLELHPPRPVHRAQPRPLPSLHHGTVVVGRTSDLAALRDGLLRTIASVAAPLGDGRVRLTGLPLLVDGGAVLAPAEVADSGSLRRLRNSGHTPVYVSSVVVDTSMMSVHIPAPFGQDAAPIVAPLLQWWLPLHGDDAARASLDLSVAQVVAHATQRLATPWFDDETDGPAAAAAGTAALHALVALVERLPPQLGSFVR